AIASATYANSRAFSASERPRSAEMVWAIWKSWPGGLHVPLTSTAQKKAICVCSVVRKGLLRAPSRFTSLTWLAYRRERSSWSMLVKPSGPSLRNWVPASMHHGTTPTHSGLQIGLNSGGVGRYQPGEGLNV